MNFRQLRSFVKVVETGSMTRAAAELYLAQPALGMQVRQLEEDLGVVLLRRHSRGVEPTEAGRVLYHRARDLLSQVEAVRREVSSISSDAGESIRLGMSPSLIRSCGADIAVQARETLPQVLLSLAEEMSHVLADRLLRDELDVVLAYGVPEHAAIRREALRHEDLVLVTLPEEGGQGPVTLAQALEYRLAIPERHDVVREVVTQTAREMGLEAHIVYEVRSVPAIRALVLRGAAASILPMASVAEDVRAARLQARPVVEPALRRTLYLAWSGKRQVSSNEATLHELIRRAVALSGDDPGAEPSGS